MAELSFLKYRHSEVILKVEATGAETVDIALDTDIIDTDRDNLVGEDQEANLKSIFYNVPDGIEFSRYLSGGSPEKEGIYSFSGTGTVKFDSFNTIGAAESTGKERDIRLVFSGAGSVIMRLGKMNGYAAKYNPAVDGYNAIEPS